MQDIIVGCIQIAVRPADVDHNLARVKRGLAELSARNCQIAVLPEMWSCSFPYPVLREMAKKTPPVLDDLQDTARREAIAISGSLPEEADGKVYNTCYFIDTTGEIAGTYRKVHLFSLYNEHKNFGRGDSACVIPTSFGKIGLMICYDLRFPELARTMALEGADIICVSSMWPLTRLEHWTALLRARAIENQLFMVGCNGCGEEGKITWGGGSSIVSPLGTIVAQAGPEEKTIVGVLDQNEKDEFRRMIPCFEDRVPAAYRA
ncbi:MAG: carbon-nitrogen family hydrolase [Desulfobacteraceae bacterium]|nr:carbon-nitrogen family hydrolase [Desulfobacteraceae bacterium]